MLKRSRRWYWQMTKVRVCVSDEAFYYPTGIDGWPGCSAYSFSLSASASKLARPAPAAVTFGWLAAERLWPTRREPGTLITALTLSQLSAAPLCCHHHRAKKRLLLFHTHLLVLSSSSRLVSSFKRSVSFRQRFRRWLYSSFTGSLTLNSLPSAPT